MTSSVHAGDVLVGRYRMVDLLAEEDGGALWNAYDRVLHRPVAVHLIPVDDPRSDALLEAARRAAPLTDRRNLRVLDCNRTESVCYVVNEWGTGTSLDVALEANGPLPPGRAAWLVAQVADTVATSHAHGTSHGRLVPENIMVDENGEVRIIGFGVEAALHGLPADEESDVHALVSLLYASLTGRWPGRMPSRLRSPRLEHGKVLRPRQVRAGIPRQLDRICDAVFGEHGADRAPVDPLGLPFGAVLGQRPVQAPTSAAELRDALEDHLDEFEPDLSGSPTIQGHTGPGAGLSRSALDAMAPVTRPWTPPEEQHVPSSSPGTPPSPSATSALAEEPATEAGMPVFDDDSDVDWRSTAGPSGRGDAAGRPLFASEEESVARRERVKELFGGADVPPAHDTTSSGAASSRPALHPGQRRPEEYWPWDTTDPGALSGSGAIPRVDGAPVPGRTWMRLAWAVGIAAVAFFVVMALVQTLNSTSRDDDPPAARRSSTPAQTPTGPLEKLSVTDLDPQGQPPEEYPEDAPKAVDDDPESAWGTQTYTQQFGPGGLKTGVGLVVDLGEAREVKQVQVSVRGGETAAQVFVSGAAPTDVTDLEPVGATSGEDVLTFTFAEPHEGRFVTVWLTKIPAVEGGFRGEVTEIDVFA